MPDPCKPEGNTYHSRQTTMARIKQEPLYQKEYNKNDPKMSGDDIGRLWFWSLFLGVIILVLILTPSLVTAFKLGLHEGRCTVVNYGIEEFKSNEYDKSVEMVVEKSYWKIHWQVYYNSVDNNPRVQNKFNEPGYIWNKEKKLYESKEVAMSELEKYGINQVYECSLYQKNYQNDDRVYNADWAEWGYMMAPGYIVAIFAGSLVFTVWLGVLLYCVYDQYCRGCCDGCRNDIEKGYKDTIEKVEEKIESIKNNGVKDKYPEVKVVEKKEDTTEESSSEEDTADTTEESSSEEDSISFDSAFNTEEEEERKEQNKHNLNVAMEKLREYCRLREY
jgi:hypothetical protein